MAPYNLIYNRIHTDASGTCSRVQINYNRVQSDDASGVKDIDLTGSKPNNGNLKMVCGWLHQEGR